MDHKVYYGEYTLEHWIDLMLSKNIVLPDYQRHFVWNQEKVRRLVESFENGSFVPPVTIGVLKINEVTKNMILDGQQRLSSLLLAYVQRFPKKMNNIEIATTDLNENDDVIEDLEPIIDWTFENLLTLGKDRETIMAATNNIQYDNVDYGCSHSFFKKKKLGFSYIVPSVDNEAEQTKFYSTVFRNINIHGINLTKEEGRKSLYFLDSNLEGYFDPDLGDYFVNHTTARTKMDFLRYLALLANYHQLGRETNVASGYKSRMEEYYENYIYSVVNGDDSPIFGLFTSVYPNRNYDNDISRLRQNLDDLHILHEYQSVIDMDIYMFGLIYITLFLKHNLNSAREQELKTQLTDKIIEIKQDSSHKKSPSAQKYLRLRIKASIDIYNNYVV